jgi:hypothetical protein
VTPFEADPFGAHDPADSGPAPSQAEVPEVDDALVEPGVPGLRLRVLYSRLAGFLPEPAVIHRLRIPGVILGVALGVALGVTIGRAGADFHGTEAGASAQPLVQEREEPATEVREIRPPADSAVVDWADSVYVPDWVRLGDGSRSRPGRGYVPLGAEGAGATRPDLSYAPAAVRASPASPAPPAIPVLVRRAGGSRVLLHDVGVTESVPDPLLLSPDWSLAGNCGTTLGITRVYEQSGTLRAEARELSRMGDWIFGLAVPAGSCAGAAPRSSPRVLPDPAERRGLSFAVGGSEMLRGIGAPSFAPGDLREMARGPRGATGRHVWGIFRRSEQGTQISPPPPAPQLAFVAHTSDGERWEILWAKYTDLHTETLGLAGVFDSDADGRHEAFFAIRSSDGNNRMLHVGPDEAGAWRLVRSTPFDAAVGGP